MEATKTETGLYRKTSIPCIYESCSDFARENSKFCSHRCGTWYMYKVLLSQMKHDYLENVKKREDEQVEVKNNLLEKFKEDFARDETIPNVNTDDIKMIKEILGEKAVWKDRKEHGVTQRIQLEEVTQKAKDMVPCVIEDDKKKFNDLVDCYCCGHTFPSHAYISHTENCFIKAENNYVIEGQTATPEDDGSSLVYCDFYNSKRKSYCKKLRANCSQHSEYCKIKKANESEVCGCPIDDGTLCTIRKRDCLKHYNWENIKRAKLYLEEISTNQVLSSLEFEQKMIEERVVKKLINIHNP